MAIPPLPPIGAVPPIAPNAPAAPTGGAPSAGFGQALTQGLQQVSSLEHQADALSNDLLTGGPTRIHDVMVATSESALAVDLLVQVRDRALEAYQEVMRLQL
ncbi:flagellar hook-basal body complex protein FliE [Nitriliruptoraceae bacterium ZYF776]|nr:flagellar hook-basal body complex protein FliE [Profundirhabdus halotolerans]